MVNKRKVFDKIFKDWEYCEGCGRRTDLSDLREGYCSDCYEWLMEYSLEDKFIEEN